MYEINNPNNRLNILELHRKINQRNEKKSICYEKVLEICNRRILAQTERDKTNCIFEFPEYVIGYPLFDLNMCIKYCEKHLVANGFLVKYMFPNKFYISWDFDEIKKHKEEERKKLPLVAVLPKKNNMIQNINKMHGDNVQTSSMKQMQLPNSENTKNDLINQPNNHITQTNNMSTLSNTILPPIVKKPNTFVSHIDPALHAKITEPLPTTLPEYNPFDLYPPSIHDNKTNINNENQLLNKPEPKKTAIDNSFFANSFKQTLTSGIGTTKLFEYKPSGKLTLNL